MKAMPKECSDLLDSAMKELASQHDAEDQAFRRLHHAGWYETVDGWKQLGPDVRDRINVRKAVKQFDGSYLIPDVDVFYPNAVKRSSGEQGSSYSAADVQNAIDNTNRAISSGGQAPALAKGHPHPLQKMSGYTPPAFGSGFNFRESPRGEGWARCDLKGVDEETINEWRKGRFTGLSAGFVEDAGSLNRRFGHIALLGAESQALSLLPTTEIFSVDNQLCFSVDTISMKGIEMATTEEMKEQFAAIRRGHEACAAAFASAEAGEPQAEAKIKEAFEALNKTRAEFMAEHPDEEEDKKLIAKMMKKDEDKDDEFTGQAAQETTFLPEGTKADGESLAEDIDVVNKDYAALFANQNKMLKEALLAIDALKGKQIREDFSVFCANLRADGHQFDQAQADKTFAAMKGNVDALKALKEFLRTTPKNLSLSGMGGQTFSAGQDHPNRTAQPTQDDVSEAEVMAALHKHCRGMTFTSDDYKLGAAFSV